MKPTTLRNKKLTIACIAALLTGTLYTLAQTPVATNIVDEVIWIVGDEAIFRSEVEEQYKEMKLDGTNVPASPYCAIPEELAVQKLYLHQAKVDTIEPQESQVNAQVDKRINFFIAGLGSRERVEQYFRKTIPELRDQLHDVIRTQYIIQQVQGNLTKDVKATPAQVRKYFTALPEDSVPYVPLQVEVQIIMFYPRVPQQEIDDVKARLRDYAEQVNSGKSDFATLARMYSEDGSYLQGGELGFHGRADFVPEFSNVAFNLQTPGKVSRIVETEYGYHIIQLVEKRGEQINVRHILLRPKVSSADLEAARVKMDSLAMEIRKNTFTFEEAASVASHDKTTRNNRGVMVNQYTGGGSRFEMNQLPPEVATAIENLQPGEVSDAFIMKDAAKNREVVAVVKLTTRIPGHRATLAEDYNLIKEMYLASERERIINQWVEQKIADTYIRIEDGWGNCDFKYNGWIKK